MYGAAQTRISPWVGSAAWTGDGARFLFGVLKKFPLTSSAQITEQTINGGPGFYIEEDGRPTQTMAFDIRDGRIVSVYVVRNPDKLVHLRPI